MSDSDTCPNPTVLSVLRSLILGPWQPPRRSPPACSRPATCRRCAGSHLLLNHAGVEHAQDGRSLPWRDLDVRPWTLVGDSPGLAARSTSVSSTANACTPSRQSGAVTHQRPRSHVKVAPRERPTILSMLDAGVVQEQVAAGASSTCGWPATRRRRSPRRLPWTEYQ